MRLARLGALAAVLFASANASAQNVKETCADASERGQKLVDAHELLEARNAFIACAQASCPEAVRRDCQTQLDDVKKNVPSLIVRVKGADGSDVAQGAVSLDGVSIGVLDGQDLELDPGPHAIRIDLPDGHRFERRVIVAPGERSRDVIFDARAPQSQAVALAPHEKIATRWTTVRTIGFITTLVGATGIVLGAVTQGLAIVDQNNAIALRGSSCDLAATPPTGDVNCDAAISYHQQALSAQTFAIGALLGGGVALVTGIVLFIAGGSEPVRTALRVTPAVGPGYAGLSLGASF